MKPSILFALLLILAMLIFAVVNKGGDTTPQTKSMTETQPKGTVLTTAELRKVNNLPTEVKDTIKTLETGRRVIVKSVEPYVVCSADPPYTQIYPKPTK